MTAPAWARGHDIDRLRTITAVFRQADAPYVQGAHAGVNEAQVAQWADTGVLTVASTKHGLPVAAVAARRARRAERIVDYTGNRAVVVAAGDVVVNRAAYLPGWGTAAADAVRHAATRIVDLFDTRQRVVLHLWQEDPAAHALAAALGATWQLTKVKASSELVGVFDTAAPPARLAIEDYGLARLGLRYDPAAAVADGQLMRIHLPLVTNPDVVFTSWQPDGARVAAHMPAGQAWWLDTRKPHTAVNHGKTDRVHLVVDAWATDELRRMVAGTGNTVVSAPTASPLHPAPGPYTLAGQ